MFLWRQKVDIRSIKKPPPMITKTDGYYHFGHKQWYLFMPTNQPITFLAQVMTRLCQQNQVSFSLDTVMFLLVSSHTLTVKVKGQGDFQLSLVEEDLRCPVHDHAWLFKYCCCFVLITIYQLEIQGVADIQQSECIIYCRYKYMYSEFLV